MSDGPVSGAAMILGLTLIVSMVGLLAAPKVIERCMLRPYRLVRNNEYIRLITSGFVHADFGHLVFNLITYYAFAFTLERRVGTPRFVALYLVGLVLSDLGTYYKHRNEPEYASLGASGAILAVMFAFIVYFPSASLFILPLPIPIPAPLFAIAYLAYTYFQSKHSKGRINHDAHLGGALTGLAFVALTDPAAYRPLLERVGF